MFWLFYNTLFMLIKMLNSFVFSLSSSHFIVLSSMYELLIIIIIIIPIIFFIIAIVLESVKLSEIGCVCMKLKFWSEVCRFRIKIMTSVAERQNFFSASLLFFKTKSASFLLLAKSWFPHKYFHTCHACCKTNAQNEWKIPEKTLN